MTQILHASDDSPITLTAAADREWFDDHPTRFVRLRYSTDGDIPPDGTPPAVAMVVFCPTDGLRFRHSLQVIPGSLAERWLATGETDHPAFGHQTEVALAPIVRSMLQRHHGWRKLLDAFEQCLAHRDRLVGWSDWP